MQRLPIPCIALWLALWLVTYQGTARGAPDRQGSLEALEGTVIASEARWNARGDRIFSESLIRTTDGRTIPVIQPGGTVDGIGMIQYPSPPAMRPGDQVTIQVWTTDTDQPWQVNELTSLVRPGPGAIFQRDAQERAPQLGYVRTTTEAEAPLYWASGCVFLTYDSAGSTHIAGDEELAIMDQVFATWRQSIESCSFLRFELDGQEGVEVGFDGVNAVKFREQRWCRPATEEDPEECYNPGAAGLTTLYFVNDPESARNGEILDADIELNGVNFAISSGGNSLGGTGCLADLANTMTHEVGHLMGLEHTCRLPGDPDRYDHQGNPVPLCSDSLDREVLEATMYPSQTCGETKKITLEADDIGGICTIYATEQDPGTCKRAAIGGRRRGLCSVGPGHDRSGDLASLLLPLAGVGLLLFRRRRPGARHHT